MGQLTPQETAVIRLNRPQRHVIVNKRRHPLCSVELEGKFSRP